MTHWIIEDKGFGGVVYKCSNCGKAWNDYYSKLPKDFCVRCGENIDEEENEYIEESKKYKENNTIIFPQTIGSITFYSKTELFEWIENQQKLNKVLEQEGYIKTQNTCSEKWGVPNHKVNIELTT